MGKEGLSNPGKVGGVGLEKQNPSSSSQDICSVPPCRRLATVPSGYCSSGFSLQFDF